ncbi:unknown protein [Microcystis aeruginosa NIES-843]|uniref:Uncharacterized protein n=1 Tax=Microcystis aeruginosa (strain NIES-843 / IAM M-2473) TaxID=449447 RepID=B0JG77_MICAN|nr:unknown protein [Microcystis aeruginosa NIES-843]
MRCRVLGFEESGVRSQESGGGRRSAAFFSPLPTPHTPHPTPHTPHPTPHFPNP